MRLAARLMLPGLLAACTGSPAPTPAPRVERPDAQLAHELPAGSVLRLLPVKVVTPGEFDADTAAAWWREALRQSARFDIAAPPDDVSELPDRLLWRLELGVDLTAKVLTATLMPPDGPAVPLGSSSLDLGLAPAIDRLAWRCRIELGDDGDAPVPVTECYSHDPRAVRDAERAQQALHDGDFAAALRAGSAARRLDGGSPFVLELLASASLLRADAESARKLAEEALSYSHRLSPPTTHRLLRSLLLARGAQHPGQGPQRDQELLVLGEVAARERPFDPQVQLTRALAFDFLDRFEEALPILQRLAVRLPGHAMVQYHLGWAALATGDAAAAVAAFTAAAAVLPRENTVLPRAIALYESGQHQRLDEWLQELLAEALSRPGTAAHQLRRMMAAHALLTDRARLAGDLMLDDLAWLLQRPSLLDNHIGEIADAGEVLVRLGRAGDLGAPLQTLASLRPNGAQADVLSFLTGLQQVALTGRPATAIEASLARADNLNVWSSILKAVAHQVSGEVLDEYSALTQAAKLSDSPLVKAALVRSLRATGRVDDAAALRAALRRELSAIHLRRPLQHPLLGPELALSFLAQ